MNTPILFELAKLLKEKGFDVPVRTYRLEGKYPDFVHEGFEDDYWGDNKVVNWNKDVIGIKPFKGFVSAPTIAEVVMWLYEKHGVWITVCVIGVDGFGYWLHDKGRKRLNPDNQGGYWLSPTEAYKAAIEYCLTKLI